MDTHMRPDDDELIGRAHERDLVAALLAGPPGSSRVLHLGGGPGTGKSAVLRFAAHTAARRGVAVLSTSWAPAERMLPHAALHGLLHSCLPRLGTLPPEERALLEAAFGTTAAAPTPTPGNGPAPTPHTAPTPPDLARAALRLLRAAPGPVLLCVDDLDRLDGASRATLRAMAHLCGDSEVRMAVAERAAPAGWLPASAYATVLRPLPAAEARELMRRHGLAAAPTEEELVLAVARGNPLALTELSVNGTGFGEAAGLGLLPASARLAEAYEEELEALSARGTSMLLVAALSTSATLREILAAGERLLGTAQDARTGLTETMAHGLIAERAPEGQALEGEAPAVRAPVGHAYFPQPLIRVAVLHREPTARRMAAHAALERSATDPAHAAWHAAQRAAGADEERARCLAARAAGPWPGTTLLVALSALEGAARLSPDPRSRAERLLRAAELACHHGLDTQARRYARGIDPAELGDLGRAMLLWLHDVLPGGSPAGQERIGQLCSAARSVAATHPLLAQKLLHTAAGRCWWQQTDDAERERVARTVRELRTPPWSARDLVTLALADALSISHEPLRLSEPPAPDERLFLGQAAHLTGDLEQAAHFLADAERAARAGRRTGRLPQILEARALGGIWLGTEWQTARARATEARQIAAELGHADYAARAIGALGVIEALQGHHDKALERAAETEEASRRLGQDQHLNLATLTRVLTASGTGRYAEAYTQLRSSFTDLLTPYSFQQFWGLAFLVEAALPAGERDDVRAVVEEVARRTRTGRAPMLRRVLAYADAALAPDDEAEARYQDALRDDAARWPLLHAMTHLNYGVRLRRRRRVVESRGPLATAEALFLALGAASRAELAASELRAAGRADTARRAATAPAGETAARVLSPQQLTIARLAARGLSNRAIGEQLHLSARTVASHLYQIFPRLDVTSRAQLAGRRDLQ
ncbi:AAA family ATPase [Streptomyces sp. NPDC049813]|uniref:AAA family ATPase n=1 Tax=Streptomyces sp. NPDC049813 TaxID=3365597 RepID=UPI003797ED88